MKLTPPSMPKLEDEDAELVRRELERKVVELQQLACSALTVIPGINLEDGVSTPVAHGLGRPTTWARESCVRGAVSTGRVEEIRDGSQDRKKFVVLKATGWGATITIDLVVL